MNGARCFHVTVTNTAKQHGLAINPINLVRMKKVFESENEL